LTAAGVLAGAIETQRWWGMEQREFSHGSGAFLLSVVPSLSLEDQGGCLKGYLLMSQIQHGLSRTEYMRLRAPYLPQHRRIVFVLESPPKSGLYFYNPEGRVSEPLFSAMMKDVIGKIPNSKDEGLCEFAHRGFLLIDATYTPVNHDHLTLRERNKRILDDLPLLIGELREYVGPKTGVVLVKANVCTLLEPILTTRGFPILNRGRVIPFPSTGQQNRFREAVCEVLGSTP
jgi:hypothetical protein